MSAFSYGTRLGNLFVGSPLGVFPVHQGIAVGLEALSLQSREESLARAALATYLLILSNHPFYCC
jgi:hypothetical protein